MKTRSQERGPRLSAVLPSTALIGLLLCASSCSTLPDQDEGLVGIIQQSVARHDSGSVVGKRNAVPQPEPLPLSPEPDSTGISSATNALAAGLPSYRISPGDVLAASYFARPSGEIHEYRIDSQDVLSISVAALETRTTDVTVRPDGCISYFLIGDLPVRGQSVAQVRSNIAASLTKTMPAAEVTVILRESNGLAKEFLNTLKSNTDLGSTRILQVRNDGTVTFPIIGEVTVSGKTLTGLSREVENQYDRIFRGGISVALNLNTSSDGNIAVLGEVKNPGRYTVNSPISPFFALAMAGGALDTAKKSQIVIVKRQPNGRVAWHVVNLDENSGEPLGPEIALTAQDMLLVPKTGIASLNTFVEQYVRRMLPMSVGYGSGNWTYTAYPH